MERLSFDSFDSFRLIDIGEEHKKDYFKAHRHEFYEIIYITKGKGKHKVDFETYEFKENSVYLIRPHQIHEWLLDDFNGEYDGYIIWFSEDFLFHKKILTKLFDIHTCLIEIDKDTTKHLSCLTHMMKYELSNKKELTSRIFNLFLFYINRNKVNNKSISRDPIIYKLNSLIEANFVEEKSAKFYADKLELTTKRLNELTKKNLDKTLSSLIIERVIVEAKRELIYSRDLTIKEVSEKLGFQEVGHFSRYFKKYNGSCPQAFRNKNILIG